MDIYNIVLLGMHSAGLLVRIYMLEDNLLGFITTNVVPSAYLLTWSCQLQLFNR